MCVDIRIFVERKEGDKWILVGDVHLDEYFRTEWHSYFTVKELLDHDWNQKILDISDDYTHGDEAKEFMDEGIPQLLKHGT
tara:strand:+ start:1493 stop:1735 length:243 start_codon:yes stop_codon:yes gene_type:complete